ncbi:MAG: ABC transporter permease, partial [Bacteroidales bacterium]
MINSDFKAAVRSILRNKIPSLISILGLGIGLGCIIILLALIIHEKSFDKSIPGHRNVYRIVFGSSGQTYSALAENMAIEFPEVKGFFRYFQPFSIQLKTPANEVVSEQNFGFADSSIFRIIGIKFVSGTFAKSATEVAVSDEVAMKYFANLSPIGEVIRVRFPDGFLNLIISGVFRSFPSNSTLNPSFLTDIRMSEKMLLQFQRTLGEYAFSENRSSGWNSPDFLTYVVLDKSADPGELSVKMEKYREFIPDERKDSLSFKLQPVTEIYLGSGDITGSLYLRKGNREELKYYEIISVLILLISIANYVLLARASVSERTHELGTRKVFGASQTKIRRLILLESGIIVLLSLIPASFVIDIGLSFVNTTLNKTLTSQVFLSPVLWLLLLAVVLLTGFLAGWIIGLNYSRIPALKLISGKLNNPSRSQKWNYSFLVLHFTIYMMLVS